MIKTIIIAEAGVNHNGSVEIAKKLIDIAAGAGADYVKFQTFKTEQLVSIYAKKANYQMRNLNDKDDSQYSMIKKLELSENVFVELKDYCITKGIKFLSTGFDEQSIDFLDTLGMDFFKIPSGEVTNKPYLQHIAHKGKPVIMSTGMATLEEIDAAIMVLKDNGLNENNITVLHCNTEYPTPLEDVNLKAMLTIRDTFNLKTGYSDHTLGIEVAIAAVALGACVIEKHFTLDRSLPGPDHKASLEPMELKEMVKSIRNIEQAISRDGKKKPSQSEVANKSVARTSIHFSRNLSKGQSLSREDLIMKRPGDGISPMEVELFIGKILVSDVIADQMLKREDVL